MRKNSNAKKPSFVNMYSAHQVQVMGAITLKSFELKVLMKSDYFETGWEVKAVSNVGCCVKLHARSNHDKLDN